MLLRELLASPDSSRRYLERYVNDGSPSGFTEKFTSSAATSPFGEVDEFNLLTARFPMELIEDLGRLPGWWGAKEVPLHPDMGRDAIVRANCLEIRQSSARASPTASARTIELVDCARSGYLKLNYRGLLGRVNRQLTRAHALSAIDVTTILDAAARRNSLPDLFSYLREPGARVASLRSSGGVYEWGTVFRELLPTCLDRATAILVPVFSLFAIDRRRPQDPPLLQQLIKMSGRAAVDYVYDNILAPIVTCYFALLRTLALQFECNAQNLLLGFTSDGTVSGVVFRDFESVDKDESLVEDLGLEVEFTSHPFKCVHRGLYNYSIKHSFMYDFKLGEYVLAPVLACGVTELKARCELSEKVRALGRSCCLRLPSSFFPDDGLWYSYDNVIVDKTKKRPYVGRPNPKYR